ncbi:DNA primase [Boudabousia liubingyangii]|uniref:DNA primase n=1 Tax=Boudabousia liubingyangii TaxID=1921764 RepID=A0A1Q5PN87_9ACTO|nr:DNA primase [Boudabousia liubingyangii]OKL47488.1 DNA primase [Boudabousia liubingyangii]OKL48910.1 DNA primase [Boudabousia liubingyangii]
MAGLIRREDIAAVREAARIEDIVSEHVTLRTAGVGSLKGLCPFHEEKTPSFHVRPGTNYWHCFGCGEGGDVISFVEKINHVTFVEAVEYLAEKTGVTLQYEDGPRGDRPAPGQRQRLIEAHRVAEEYFKEQLFSREAVTARRFLAERGFTPEHAKHFGLGYAPQGWDNLTKVLRKHGFTEEELAISGLASKGQRGVYDRFRGRLLWPIRDITGATVGFGARRLSDDDNGPKYLNTPETPIYKKSQVLYGLDLAKKEISTTKEVIVVEGYTDVMAMHVAGKKNAVATCGTAFGSEHAKLLSRLIGTSSDSASGVVLADGQTRGGRVIFTFDGDAAGQKAALRAFNEDQRFAAQTYVAVEASGMDPCDLRLARGDEALANLVQNPQPLFAFVIRNALNGQDLDTVEGRVRALRQAAPVLASIRDKALASGYEREVAGWLGVEAAEVHRAARNAKPIKPGEENTPNYPEGNQAQAPGPNTRPNSGRSPQGNRRMDPVTATQAQILAGAIQVPGLVDAAAFDALDPENFSVPSLRAVKELITVAGGLAHFNQLARQANDPQLALKRWGQELFTASAGTLDQVLTKLSVHPLPASDERQLKVLMAESIVAMRRLTLNSQIARLRGQLSRGEVTGEQAEAVFKEIVDLENQRRALSPSDY